MLDPVLQLRLEDPHEARALEFEECCLHNRAHRVRWCIRNPNRKKHFLRRRGRAGTCKDRLCPSCAVALAKLDRLKIEAAMSRMTDPTHWVLHVYAWPHKRGSAFASRRALGAAVDVAKTAFGKLRQRRFFIEVVAGGTGVLEPLYDVAKGFWNPHFHLVLDTFDLDQEHLHREWRALTGGRGGAFYDPNNDDPDADDTPLAKYLAKTRDWAPPPRALGIAEFEALALALKGRQRFVRPWGSALPGQGDNIVPDLSRLV